jgi:DNA invertase Pin-like site-specific DNA recombinase
MPTAILYTRQSPVYNPTGAQQLDCLRSYSASHGVTIIRTLCNGTPIINKSTRRVCIDALLRAIDQKQAGMIVVSSINLLGRSLGELVAILAMATNNAVGIVALDERIDTTAMPTMPVAVMIGILGSYQRFLRREAALVGQRAAKAAGVKFGRPRISDAKVAKAREALAEGIGIRPAARLAGISPAKALEIQRAMRLPPAFSNPAPETVRT